MYVIYDGIDEVIVCEEKDEKKMLKDFFKEGGRNVEDYDRSESRESGILVTAKLRFE